jgi:di/tricarboxylate transporter
MNQTDEEMDEKIDALLAEWQESIEAPQDFRREVWRRVELSGPCRHGILERLAWWLLRPMREVVLLALVVLVALIWGLTHPPEPEYSAHDAYLLSISPFDPHHYEELSR